MNRGPSFFSSWALPPVRNCYAPFFPLTKILTHYARQCFLFYSASGVLTFFSPQFEILPFLGLQILQSPSPNISMTGPVPFPLPCPPPPCSQKKSPSRQKTSPVGQPSRFLDISFHPFKGKHRLDQACKIKPVPSFPKASCPSPFCLSSDPRSQQGSDATQVPPIRPRSAKVGQPQRPPPL